MRIEAMRNLTACRGGTLNFPGKAFKVILARQVFAPTLQ
jgi:hypothetical protein